MTKPPALRAAILVAVLSAFGSANSPSAAQEPPVKGGGRSAQSSSGKASPRAGGPAPSADELVARRLAKAALAAVDAAARTASRETYRRQLEELHKTRRDRKRESVEAFQAKHRRLLGRPGLEDEMRVHADRVARLRRIGNLLISEGSDYATRMKVYSFIVQEFDRHNAKITQMEDELKATKAPGRGG